MMINIEARTVNKKLVWQSPKVFFDTQLKYRISVRKFFCCLSVPPATFEMNVMMYLKSNLVDLDALNTSQELLLFRFDNRFKNQFIKILIPEYHSLVLYELENAIFQVRDFNTDQLVPIRSAFIQLEVSEYSPHGRV